MMRHRIIGSPLKMCAVRLRNGQVTVYELWGDDAAPYERGAITGVIFENGRLYADRFRFIEHPRMFLTEGTLFEEFIKEQIGGSGVLIEVPEYYLDGSAERKEDERREIERLTRIINKKPDEFTMSDSLRSKYIIYQARMRERLEELQKGQ